MTDETNQTDDATADDAAETNPAGDQSASQPVGDPTEGKTPDAANVVDDGTARAGDPPVETNVNMQVPEAYRLDDGTADISKLIARAEAADAADASRQEANGEVPENADGYDTLAVSEDIKLWNGTQFKLDESDPLLGKFKELAHELGIGKEGANKLLNLGAEMGAAQLNNAFKVTESQVQAAIGQLGETDAERVARYENLLGALEKAGGKTGAEDAYRLMTEVRSLESFKFLENLLGVKYGDGTVRSPANVNGDSKEPKSLADRLFSNGAS